MCLGTKNVVLDAVKEDVLKVGEKGESLVENFITARLAGKTTASRFTMSSNKAPLVSRMYKVNIQSIGVDKQKELKAGWNLIQRFWQHREREILKCIRT